MGKRLDLQSLRGIAILQVLLYHFWPDIFPNGYIGVDLFFVLSGFLISMILHRNKDSTVEMFKNFYYSRVKRIFPAYLLFIFLTLCSLFFIFPETNIALNLESAFPALFFYTNLLTTDEVSRYDAMLALGENLFTHTWSLAVEIQFYLIVPFIYLTGKYLGIPKSALLISVISVASLLFYLLADENTAFNYVFARMWQFLSGYIAFLQIYMERTEKVSEKNKLNDISLEGLPVVKQPEETEGTSKVKQFLIEGFVLIIPVTILFLGFTASYEYNNNLLRGAVTILAAIFIYFGERIENPIFSFPPLCYLGDISYILYLVHYPIHVYLHLHGLTSTKAKLNGISLAILSAILLHEVFEKFYLKLKKTPILILVTLLYFGSIGVVLFSPQIKIALAGSKLNFEDVLKNPNHYTIEDITKINRQFNVEDRRLLKNSICEYEDGTGPFGVCRAKGNSSKPYTALIIGNSYAPNTFPAFYKSCNNSFKSITMKSHAACEILWKKENFKHQRDCAENHKMMIDYTQKINPDYLYIISRHIWITSKIEETQNDWDEKVKEIKSIISQFEGSVKRKIFILTAFKLPPLNLIKTLNTALKKMQTSHNLFSQPLADKKKYSFPVTRRIIKNATADCSKCQLMDINPYFTDENKTFHYYNEENGMSYFVDSKHFSQYGIQKLLPLYQEYCTEHL